MVGKSIMDPSLSGKRLDLIDLHAKIKDKLFELKFKREMLIKANNVIQERKLERLDLERCIGEKQRELEETNIQLEIAVKAARQSENEKCSAREELTTQQIQIESLLRQRDMLQSEIRSAELENSVLRNRNEQMEDKLKRLTRFEETYSTKHAQCSSALTDMEKQITSLEQNHMKLKRVFKVCTSLSKKVLLHFNHMRCAIEELKTENSELNEKIVQQTAKLYALQNEPNSLAAGEPSSCHCQKQWSEGKNYWETKVKECEEENKILREALETSNLVLLKMQGSSPDSLSQTRPITFLKDEVNNESDLPAAGPSSET